MPEVFDLGCLTNIRRNQELISVQTKNLFNSVLLSLIDRDVDHMILSKPSDDPEPYFSPPPSPLTHMMSEPQPLSSDSLPSPPPITPTSTSAIIQSDTDHIIYKIPGLLLLTSPPMKTTPRRSSFKKKIHWRKKSSKNKHHCRLCYESGHVMINCWTFKCSYCNNKALGHWARNCLKKPSELTPMHLNTPYNNEIIKLQCVSSEL